MLLGVHCDTLCPRGFYGDECQKECDCQNESSCDQISGVCSCSRGWQGPKCNMPCKPGKYGFGCEEECTESVFDGNIIIVTCYLLL